MGSVVCVSWQNKNFACLACLTMYGSYFEKSCEYISRIFLYFLPSRYAFTSFKRGAISCCVDFTTTLPVLSSLNDKSSLLATRASNAVCSSAGVIWKPLKQWRFFRKLL